MQTPVAVITAVQCGSLVDLATEISAGTAPIVTPLAYYIIGKSVELDECRKLLIAYLIPPKLTIKQSIYRKIKRKNQTILMPVIV